MDDLLTLCSLSCQWAPLFRLQFLGAKNNECANPASNNCGYRATHGNHANPLFQRSTDRLHSNRVAKNQNSRGHCTTANTNNSSQPLPWFTFWTCHEV